MITSHYYTFPPLYAQKPAIQRAFVFSALGQKEADATLPTRSRRRPIRKKGEWGGMRSKRQLAQKLISRKENQPPKGSFAFFGAGFCALFCKRAVLPYPLARQGVSGYIRARQRASGRVRAHLGRSRRAGPRAHPFLTMFSTAATHSCSGSLERKKPCSCPAISQRK